MHAAQIVGEAELAVAVGAGDQLLVRRCLLAVDVEELGCGLEVGAGEAGVGVRAVLLGWSTAVAVGEAVADAGKVVLGPFGVSGQRVGVVGNELAGGVDALSAVVLEGVANGVVVDLRSGRSCAGWRGRAVAGSHVQGRQR